MRVTLKDIARASGYSVTTVSRALGGFDDVNEQTREHILHIAEELGYQPNIIARQLRSRRTHTIGIVIPEELRLEDDFFSILIKGIGYTAARHNYDLLISAQVAGRDEMDSYRRLVGGRRVDGMILARTHRDDARIKYLKSAGHPFVVAGRAGPDQPSDFPYIDADSQTGLCQLVEHFIDYGHRHIGLILPPDGLAYTPYRLAGYREGLEAAGLPYRTEYVAAGDLGYRSGYEAALALLDRAPDLTAIIACNDEMAMGAMAAAQERGKTVGEDFGIGGFDDIPAARHTTPSLTTIRQPIYQIGEQLAEMLIKIIADQPVPEPGILLEPTLVIRESSGHNRSTV